ncbi:hypothetical protein G6F56_001566 [Rhizopus delemar]|nr:hypothetical protein G6F56_001566 [Rhizopus delemar]
MIILITGGTNGLGRLTAKNLIEQDHTVIITGRSQCSLDAARQFIITDPAKDSHLHELIIDLADLKAMTQAVQQLKFQSIDVVVHNAGGVMAHFEHIGDSEATVFTNAIGPLYLHTLLIPLVEKSTHSSRRILFVTSSLHDPNVTGGSRSESSRIPASVELQDLKGRDWDGMKYYRISKLGSLWNAYWLANDSTVPVISFCPGFVPSTELNRQSGLLTQLLMKYVLTWFSFAVSEQTAAEDYVFYITQPVENGKHYRKRQVCSSSKDSLDVSKQEAYWRFANEQIKKQLL